MNRFLKITLIALLSIVSLLVLAGGIISYYFHDEVIGFVIESINRQVTSRIEVRSAHFSIFRKFPNAAVEFKNVAISPAPDFDTLSFDSVHSSRLLVAESVFAELNLLELLTGNYRITRIEVHDGNLNVLTDKKGKHNFIFWKMPENPTGEGSAIELQNVTLRNVEVYYGHKRSNTTVALYAERAQLGGKFASQQYSLSADWQGAARLLSIGDGVLIRDKPLQLTGTLDVDNQMFTVRESILTLAKVETTVSGGFTTGNNIELNLHVEGRQLDYASVVSILPDPYRKILNDYPGKGDVHFSADITGQAGGGKMPHIEARFGMMQGRVMHRKSKIQLTGLSFTASFTTGAKSRRATCALHVSDLSCKLGGGTLKGSLAMRNFVQPQITARIAGNMDLEQLRRFMPEKQITAAGGSMTGDITVNIRLKRLLFTKASDIESVAIGGAVKFNDASLHLRTPVCRLDRINGAFRFGKQIAVHHLTLMFNGNDLAIDGYLEQLPSYLLQQSKTVRLKADITSQQLCVDSLLRSGATVGKKETGAETAPLQLPANIELDTRIKVAKFRYRTLETEQMSAHLVYRPRMMEIQTIAFTTMAGKIAGSGTITGDAANQLNVRGETTLSQVDVKQLFGTFDNFGQKTLRAEHVKGRLSGDLGFAVAWNQQMQLLKDELTVEGRMDLEGGALTDFTPLNNLSRFVALEELQNIRFSNLHTRLSIGNQKLTLPQTDIRTSAFDIVGAGEHYFDNRYTYRVKILLSELLAAKARKAKRENRENEYSEDGGKRAALYLKIEGRGDNFKIGYDKQSARTSVATDIRNEKQNMKNILKEEFGWFKKDTLTVPSVAPKNTGTLRFTFDDDPQTQDGASRPKKTEKKHKTSDSGNDEKIKVEWE